MKAERRRFYQEQSDGLAGEIRRLRKRGRAFVVAELAAFAAAIAAVAAYVSTDTGYTYLYLAGVMVVAYVAIRQQDVRNSERTQEREARRSVYQKELAYLDGDFSVFADGAAYIDPQHPFAVDMDVFGRDSLFQRINRTITSSGSDWLARELAEWPCREIRERQEAIRELAEREELRTQFLAYGQQRVVNTAEILSALKGIEETQTAADTRRQPLPSHVGEGPGVGSVILPVVGTIGAMTTIVLSVADVIPSSIPLLWVFLQFGIVFALNNTAFRLATKAANRMNKELRAYVSLIHTIVESGLKARESQAVIARLTNDGGDALRAFKELQRILDGLDRQGNPLYRFLSDALFCGDFWLVRRFGCWQGRYLSQIEDWIAAVSHFDGLVSMATFRYNEPSAIDAEVVGDCKSPTTENGEVVYEAEALSHPFLGERAVPNDFRLSDGHYYIVTGANMAGKSTFLRTIGANYILARCGMPVFARRLRVSRFCLFSSMRTTDDLTQGISYFNAELLRLGQLIDYCREHRPTLIILDEILKGTNSLDKLNGSRLFLEHISQQPVTGIIATHDLELSRMADERPDRFHNHCFEIALSDSVTYTYKITEGVARNQNATFLLKNIVLNTAPQ